MRVLKATPMKIALVTGLLMIVASILSVVVDRGFFDSERSPRLVAGVRTEGWSFNVSSVGGRLQVLFEPGSEILVIRNEGNKSANDLEITIKMLFDQERNAIEGITAAPPHQDATFEILEDELTIIGRVERLTSNEAITITVHMNLPTERAETLTTGNGKLWTEMEYPFSLLFPFGEVTFKENWRTGENPDRAIYTGQRYVSWEIDRLLVTCQDCSALDHQNVGRLIRDISTPIPPYLYPVP